MNENCVFCHIIQHQPPAEIMFQDDRITAFRDQHPAAPVHILLVPNQHFRSLNDVTAREASLLSHILLTARQIAIDQHIDQSGYRLVTNINADGGQSVFHLHFHLIGGQPLGRPTR